MLLKLRYSLCDLRKEIIGELSSRFYFIAFTLHVKAAAYLRSLAKLTNQTCGVYVPLSSVIQPHGNDLLQ